MIKPDDVTVDRTLEAEWSEQIDTELAKDWGPYEVWRCVELKGKFGEMSALVSAIRDAYEAVGWTITTNVPSNAPDKYQALRFRRPGPVYVSPTEAEGAGSSGLVSDTDRIEALETAKTLDTVRAILVDAETRLGHFADVGVHDNNEGLPLVLLRDAVQAIKKAAEAARHGGGGE